MNYPLEAIAFYAADTRLPLAWCAASPVLRVIAECTPAGFALADGLILRYTHEACAAASLGANFISSGVSDGAASRVKTGSRHEPDTPTLRPVYSVSVEGGGEGGEGGGGAHMGSCYRDSNDSLLFLGNRISEAHSGSSCDMDDGLQCVVWWLHRAQLWRSSAREEIPLLLRRRHLGAVVDLSLLASAPVPQRSLDVQELEAGHAQGLLRYVDFAHNTKLSVLELGPRCVCGNLEELYLAGCYGLSEIHMTPGRFTQSLAAMMLPLRVLVVSSTSVTTLSPLTSRCPFLEELDVCECLELSDLEECLARPQCILKVLRACGVSLLHDIGAGVAPAQETLRVLDVHACPSLQLWEVPQLLHKKGSTSDGTDGNIIVVQDSNHNNDEDGEKEEEGRGRGLAQLPRLEVLNISDTGLLSLSELWPRGNDMGNNAGVMAHNRHLWSLDAHRCHLLKDITALSHFSALRTLDLSDTPILSLETLGDSEGGCPLLEELCVSRCFELIHIGPLHALRSLLVLVARSCSSVQCVLGIDACTKLTHMDISGCSSLVDMGNLRFLSNLKTLCASDCLSLQVLSDVRGCTSLQEINLKNCHSLMNVSGLMHINCPNLASLNLTGCYCLFSTAALSFCVALRELYLSECSEIGGWGFDGRDDDTHHDEDEEEGGGRGEAQNEWNDNDVESHDENGAVIFDTTQQTDQRNGEGREINEGEDDASSSGEEIAVAYAEVREDVDGLRGLSTMRSLQSLYCSGMSSLTAVPGLASCDELESVDLSFCISLVDLRGLSRCRILRYCSLASASQLTDVAPLALCTSLEVVDLHGCLALSSVSALGALPLLSILDLHESSVRSVSGLEQCGALRSVSLSRCMGLKDVSPLARCPELEMLHLEESAVQCVRGLSGCHTLMFCRVWGCPLSDDAVEELEGLGGIVQW